MASRDRHGLHLIRCQALEPAFLLCNLHVVDARVAALVEARVRELPVLQVRVR
jgi:hypothetical protein